MLTDELKSIVGPGRWTTDPDTLQPHLNEWRDIWHGRTAIMVSPDDAGQVADVVGACRRAGVAVVPQGGNTGLCGGAIPDASGTQVLLSLSRMNRIRALSAEDYSITVESGCTLAAVQDAAKNAGRFFPLSLAAEGTCQIGGNLSTNAGGINVLRYGTARAQALGLEVVLADGRVWDGLRSLRKDTAGYDIKQLFIGSEGTLGIITAATLRLYPAVHNAHTAMLALRDPMQAVALLAALREGLADQIQAFELIPNRAVRFVRRHIPGIRFALDEGAPWFVLLEVAGHDVELRLEEQLAGALALNLISDAVVAKNDSEAVEMWRLRHVISEAQKKEGASLKHDVSVPVGHVGEFVMEAEQAVSQYLPGIRLVAFGHVGDGNIHFNLSQPKTMSADDFLKLRDPLGRLVYDEVCRFGGSISAEHGIGQAKRADLRRYRSEVELDLMRSMKAALDPGNLLNPGKVI